MHVCDCVLQFLQVEGGGRGCATTRPRKHRKCKKHIPPIHISKPHKTMECVRTRSPGLAHTFAQVVSNFPSEYLTLWSSYGKFIEKAALSRFSNAANLLAEELRRQITAVCGGKKLLEACSTSRKGARVCVCVRARSSLITAKFANVSVISVFLRNFKSFARNDDLTS